MDKNTFLNKMKERNVHLKFYSIEGEKKEYAFNLIQNEFGFYCVFYCERGEIIKETKYEQLNEAYDALYERILKELSYGSDLSG